jgi:ubiquitin carboxyl-terminal hydrolase 4/11/15
MHGTGVAAGAAALREGGSLQHSAHVSSLRNGVEAASLNYDEEATLPPYADGANDEPDDEGYADAEEEPNIDAIYGPLYSHDAPQWSFDAMNTSGMNDNDSDDVASDAPNLGSDGGETLEARMIEDFGDDLATHPGVSTPIEGILHASYGGVGDEEVHEIRVAGD